MSEAAGDIPDKTASETGVRVFDRLARLLFEKGGGRLSTAHAACDQRGDTDHVQETIERFQQVLQSVDRVFGPAQAGAAVRKGFIEVGLGCFKALTRIEKYPHA